ncbi:MAG: hypothetical protein COA71_10460 [SAR86 cluster bacterium]|uniref:HEPN AbiU2-like domain-containing protein n=1 Tax=SAR86 cluster bacterium TaxID=2030880 RepID=A0A2A5C9Z7_9GAMM|nr:MAG: hypothetical protein COA71_10460 [SAR86 cluster bacterium]
MSNEAKFENYKFLRLHPVDMNTALGTLKMVKRYRRDDIKVALLRDIAVINSRPFSGNRDKTGKNFLSEKKYVPAEYRDLHDRLLDLRNKQFAHTDAIFHDPKFMKWKGDKGVAFPMSFKTFDYLGLLRNLKKVEALIKSVESNINLAAREYEKAF